jgi:RHS repeat-associated protein
VALAAYDSNMVYNILAGQEDNIGQVKVAKKSTKRFYYLKDHLGSVKMTVDTTGTVVGYDDYYPYGMQMSGRSYTSSADQRYKFTGKELDATTGLDYFGARYYDGWTGRWPSVDPMTSKYPGWSPYNYCFDNSLRLVDPDGKDSVNVQTNKEQEKADRRAKQEPIVREHTVLIGGEELYRIPYFSDLAQSAGLHFVQSIEDAADIISDASADESLAAIATTCVIPSLSEYTIPMIGISNTIGNTADEISLGAKGIDCLLFGGSSEEFAKQGGQVMFNMVGGRVLNKAAEVFDGLTGQKYSTQIDLMKESISIGISFLFK